MKKFFLYSLIIFIVVMDACTPITKYLNGNFINKFDGNLTGLDSIINLDGYYHTNIGGHIFNTYYMFYRDGTFADVINIIESNKTTKDTMITIMGWGHYYLIGDTIKAQSILTTGDIICEDYSSDPVYVSERWFKILNRETLVDLYYYIFEQSNQDWDYQNTISSFHPFIDRPDSNCWLKTKPWAWKDGIIIK